LLRMACVWFGSWTVMKVYVFPWLWVNHWICTLPLSAHAAIRHAYLSLEPYLQTPSSSNRNLPPTHRPLRPLLLRLLLDLHPRRRRSNRPRLWLDRSPSIPRCYRDTRPTSPRLTHPILPCGRGVGCD
jgi:hypothetical protein